ncbi:hypothetical protein [Traorella massiliensis]|uniref:hypothetical protein n=1 Tax=Traorella massiliensis TaxID=1903263 RepID=UPI0023538C5B|nr:hypothetical protein [Traorella massiliensis]
MKVKYIVRSFLFMTGLLICLGTASIVVFPKNNTMEFGMRDVNANGILGENDNTIDVLVLGDSESYSSISPMTIWNETGITSYVCGTSAQQLYESMNFLKQALQNQKPKIVILETNAIYRNFSPVKMIENGFNQLFPIFQYHNRWKSILPVDFGGSIEYTWRDDLKGFKYSNKIEGTNAQDYMSKTDKIAEISELNRQYVKEMAKLCEENDAKFILVSTPSTVNWNYARHNGICLLADEYELDYYDLNLLSKEILIDWSQDTRDKGDHLNYYGAFKVSKYLAHFLKEKYALSDHRQEKEYQSWNESYQRYQTIVAQN